MCFPSQNIYIILTSVILSLRLHTGTAYCKAYSCWWSGCREKQQGLLPISYRWLVKAKWQVCGLVHWPILWERVVVCELECLAGMRKMRAEFSVKLHVLWVFFLSSYHKLLQSFFLLCVTCFLLLFSISCLDFKTTTSSLISDSCLQSVSLCAFHLCNCLLCRDWFHLLLIILASSLVYSVSCCAAYNCCL